MRYVIRLVPLVLLVALTLFPSAAPAVEIGAGTVVLQAVRCCSFTGVRLFVRFDSPQVFLLAQVPVGPGDVGQTFRVTRDTDPFAFDAAVSQLTNNWQFNTITFALIPDVGFALPGFALPVESTKTEIELFPSSGDFTGRIITAIGLRVDGLTLTPVAGETRIDATLTLIVEGTQPGAGLSLSATSLPESVPVGQSFTHLLTVRNDDVVPAGSVELTFGAGGYGWAQAVEDVIMTPSGGTCARWEYHSGYICDLGALPSGAEVTVSIEQTAPQAGYVQTNASAVDLQPPPPQPCLPGLPGFPSCPSPQQGPWYASVVTRVVNPVTADLSVTKFGREVYPGFIEYTVRIVNRGPEPATGVRVSEPLSVALGGGLGWWCGPLPGPPVQAMEIVCDGPSLPAGGFAFLQGGQNVDPSPSRVVTNRVTATSLELDPTPNVATADVAVGSPADIAASVIPPEGPVLPGTAVTYTLRVTNLGPSPARSIRLDHPIDPSTILAVDAPGWTCHPLPVHCTRASLGNFPDVNFADVIVTVSPPSGSLDVVGVALASNFDLNPGNNQFRATIQVGAAPTANAGADRAVNEGDLVMLDGRESTGQALSFDWEQTSPSGLSVALANPTSATPTFTAPSLGGGFGSQVLTFRLTVGSFNMTASDTVNITVKNVNHAPYADAGEDQVVREEADVTLHGENSFDPDGDPRTFSWTQVLGTPVTLLGGNGPTPTFRAPLLAGGLGGPEMLVFRLTVSDGAAADGGLSSTDEVEVRVEQVNHPPVANPGSDETRNEGAFVQLDGRASSDPDGDPITYAWTQTTGPAVTLTGSAGATPSFTAPPVSGPTPLAFELVVSDGDLMSEHARVTITVLNVNDPPQCQLAQAVPAVLWPPDHKLVPVAITGVSDPDNNGVTLRITGVTQDEPVNGTGDADTSPDAVAQDDVLLLRAERMAEENGRVYRVAFTADDGLAIGGMCRGAVTVAVPSSMQSGARAVDDGQLHDSTVP